MPTYKVLKPNEEAELLKQEENIAEDDGSSSGDFTVITRPAWLDFLYQERSYHGFRAVIPLLILLVVSMLGVIFLLSWVAIKVNQFGGSRLAPPLHNGEAKAGLATSICGNTPSQALANGCHFDIFSFGWYPRECSDMQLYNQTLAVLDKQRAGTPIFYRRGKTGSTYYDALDLSLVEEYGHGKHHSHGIISDDAVILATWEHYLVSCTYAWQKVQRAAMRSWPLDEWSSSLALARKCGPDLLDRDKLESHTITSNLQVWYPSCGLEVTDLKREVALALR